MARAVRSHIRLVAAVVTLFAAWTASPSVFTRNSSEEPVWTEHTTTALRLIDILATDKRGNPVRGLGREDFEVRINGKVRDVRSVDTASSVPTVEPIVLADGTIVARRELPERPARWTMIFLDATRTPANYRGIVCKTARALVEQAASPDDRFAVALLNGGRLRFLHEFATADRFDLSVFDDPDILLTSSIDLRHRMAEMEEMVKSCNGLGTQDSCIITRTEEFVNVMRSEAEAGVFAMRKLVAAMAPLPGRKAMVWFSNGIVLQPGQIVLDAVTRYIGEPSTIVSRLTDRGNAGFEGMLSEATRAGVSVFGLRAGSDSGADMRSAEHATVDRQVAGFGANPYKLATTMAQESLRDTADATGGKVVFTPLGTRVAEGLLDQLDGVYTLGVSAEPGDGARAKVKVRSVSKGVRIRLQGRMTDRFPPAEPVHAVLVPEDAESLRFELDVSELGRERTDKFSPEVSRVAIYAHVRTMDGRVHDPYYRLFEIRRDDESASTFQERMTFPAPAGRHVVEVFVSDLISGAQTSASAVRGAAAIQSVSRQGGAPR